MDKLRSGVPLPPMPFPLLPLRSGVLFPGTVLTSTVGREKTLALMRTLHPGDLVVVTTQRHPKQDDPIREDLHDVGVFARVAELVRVSSGEMRVVLEGLQRFRLDDLVQTSPHWAASGIPLVDEHEDEEAHLLARSLRQRVEEIAQNGGALRDALGQAPPGLVADRIAAGLGLSTEKEMSVLETLDVPARLRLVAQLVSEVKATFEIKQKIESDVRRELGKGQREALLREQLRAIQKELGEGDSRQGEGERLRERLRDVKLPEEVRAVADRELRRLESMGPQAAESHVIRTYLEWLADLPWEARAEATIELEEIARKLDADHAGLAEPKKRILEHMAVLSLTGESRGTILCFVGPPGVGKTSLGQSIADATGRPLVRVSLGGVGDEAELRGHRRTYVGALPGRILHALRKAKVKNPVVLLDEIDKLGHLWRGSPEAALLEILDPEQNKTFVDHYLELPFDLGEVMFIATANELSGMSPPLRDRLEVVELSGYTIDEKIAIAKSHLLPKRKRLHALADDALTVTDDALSTIVRDYTREAGVRQLDRELTRLCRALALEVVRSKDAKKTLIVDASEVKRYLGKVRYVGEVAERTSVPGVATGLAWTPVGGDILFIETTRMPGKGKVEITGQLGDVMKESARAALSYVRSRASELGVDPTLVEREDLHIHVPAGAVPKDGPSAGVTMFTALVSLLTGRRVRSDTAMTGECTLRGRVLPVGGIKAKVLAAHRAGLTRVILPRKNEADLDDVPEHVRASMEFLLADDMAQVIPLALDGDATSVVPHAPAQDAPGDPIRAA